MNFKKLGASLATGALLMATIAPSAFASTNVFVGGNGHNSYNSVYVNHTTTTTLSQGSMSFISNTVHTNSNTGGNVAGGNTGFGAGSSIYTGGVVTHTNIFNVGSVNYLSY